MREFRVLMTIGLAAFILAITGAAVEPHLYGFLCGVLAGALAMWLLGIMEERARD